MDINTKILEVHNGLAKTSRDQPVRSNREIPKPESTERKKTDTVEISDLGSLLARVKQEKALDLSELLSKLSKIEEVRDKKISEIQKKLKTKEILEPPNVRNSIVRMLVMMGQLPILEKSLKENPKLTPSSLEQEPTPP